MQDIESGGQCEVNFQCHNYIMKIDRPLLECHNEVNKSEA